MRARNARSYSAEDMKAILGLKESEPAVQSEVNGGSKETYSDDDDDVRPGLGAPGSEAAAASKDTDDLGVFTITSTTSLADYFKKRQLEMQQINASAAREPEELAEEEKQSLQGKKRKRDQIEASEEQEAVQSPAEVKDDDSADSSSGGKARKDKSKKDKKDKRDKKDKKDKKEKKDKKDKRRKDKK